jgi:glycosyltransferase involved in cell wall biosynthesis
MSSTARVGTCSGVVSRIGAVSVQRESKESNSLGPIENSRRRPLLTVVVPVYNGGQEIVENVGVIRREAAVGLSREDVELVVVSDGSIDGTAERLLAARSDVGMRVIHYDRNLGKGYAVKLGALAAGGRWVAIVDADLDLDPGSIPGYLEIAQRDELDFAIGSKRHPDSIVHYPRSRRIASGIYQQLNRLLFRLDVRDTQVGLKVFRHEVAEEVVPLLLVKQFAFDLELLAVARALGFGRIRELPVRLEYRFTGSEVRSRAVVRALLDTAAIFYRLRILRTYQRKRRLLGTGSLRPEELPHVTVIGDPKVAQVLDYPRLDVLPANGLLEDAQGGLLAILAHGAHPAGNWVSASVQFIARGDATAVVAPTLTPGSATLREKAAAAVLESRLGGGSRRSRYFPGNVRVVADYPAHNCVVRRSDYVAARSAGIDAEDLVAWLFERGSRTIYVPDTSVAETPSPLFAPHLADTLDHARARGSAARRTRGRSLSGATLLSFVPVAVAMIGLSLAGFGSSQGRRVGAALLIAYAVTVMGSATLAALRFRSLRVGLLAGAGLPTTQAAYVAGFLNGVARGR